MAAAPPHTLQVVNLRKRPPSSQEDNMLSTSSSTHDWTSGAAAKRTCRPAHPYSINYMHPQRDAATFCLQQATKQYEKEDTDGNPHGDDHLDEMVACADDSEEIDRLAPQWDDSEEIDRLVPQWGADERLIREMMYSLEQAIGNNQQYTEDSSSCSSSPITLNTSSNYTRDELEPNCDYRLSESEREQAGIKPTGIDDCGVSIDEEIQAMLQEAEDHTRKIPTLCANLDDCKNANDLDYLFANSTAEYAFCDEDHLGLVNSLNYHPLVLDFDCFEGPFNSF